MSSEHQSQSEQQPTRGRLAEFSVFIMLAILIWPVMAAGVVGVYSLSIWIGQIIFGPPGPAG
jgi:periplasmic nitrate reductase NapE